MTTSDLSSMTFQAVSLADLQTLTHEQMDTLGFGVVGLTPEAIVEIYNQTESELAGLSTASVLGAHFFLSIAQCMNNYMIAQRLEDEAELDVVLDYVLTFRMRPTPVRLRLLKSPEHRRSYVLIQR